MESQVHRADEPQPQDRQGGRAGSWENMDGAAAGVAAADRALRSHHGNRWQLQEPLLTLCE